MSAEAGASMNLDAPPPPSMMRRMLSVAGKRGGWAITDQVVVSAGNFITMTLVLRNLAPAHAGIYQPIFQVMIFLNSLHNALVVYPLSVKGASRDAKGLKPLATLCILLTSLLAIPLGIGALGASGYYAQTYGPYTVGASVVIAMLFYQLQETMRRALISQMRFSAAVPGDALSYLGQAAIVYMLTRHPGFRIEMAFLSMALTSALATVVQACQVGLSRIDLSKLRENIKSFWTLGRWMMLSNLTMLVTAVAYPFVMKVSHGEIGNAYMGVLANFMNLTNPLVFSVVGLIIPAVARAKAESGVHNAKKTGLYYAALGFVPLFGYYILLFCFPGFAAKLLLNENYPQYPQIVSYLRPFVFIGIVGYIANVLIAVLNGMSMSRTNFIAQMANVTATLLIGLPLTYMLGVYGQIYGGLLATLALLTATVLLFIRAK